MCRPPPSPPISFAQATAFSLVALRDPINTLWPSVTNALPSALPTSPVPSTPILMGPAPLLQLHRLPNIQSKPGQITSPPGPLREKVPLKFRGIVDSKAPGILLKPGAEPGGCGRGVVRNEDIGHQARQFVLSQHYIANK